MVAARKNTGVLKIVYPATQCRIRMISSSDKRSATWDTWDNKPLDPGEVRAGPVPPDADSAKITFNLFWATGLLAVLFIFYARNSIKKPYIPKGEKLQKPQHEPVTIQTSIV